MASSVLLILLLSYDCLIFFFFKKKNRVSELRVVELLDGLCDKMEDYTLEKVIICKTVLFIDCALCF